MAKSLAFFPNYQTKGRDGDDKTVSAPLAWGERAWLAGARRGKGLAMVSHHHSKAAPPDDASSIQLPGWLSCPDAEHLRLQLLIQAGARQTAVCGEHAGRLKLNIAAPAVEGAANRAMISFLAKALGVRQQAVKIVQGELSKRKLVDVGMEHTAAKIALVIASLANRSS